MRVIAATYEQEFAVRIAICETENKSIKSAISENCTFRYYPETQTVEVIQTDIEKAHLLAKEILDLACCLQERLDVRVILVFSVQDCLAKAMIQSPPRIKLWGE